MPKTAKEREFETPAGVQENFYAKGIAADDECVESVLADPLYKHILGLKPNYQFLHLLYRYMISVALHYYLCFTRPIDYIEFRYHCSKGWYSGSNVMLKGISALVQVMFAPMLIFAYVWFSSESESRDVINKTLPRELCGFKQTLVVCCFFTYSQFCHFWLCGPSEESLPYLYRTSMSKEYWREIFTTAGVTYAREMAHWENNELSIIFPLNTNLIFKLSEGFVGIGDKFLTFQQDYKDQNDINMILSTEYKNERVLILEQIQPQKNMTCRSISAEYSNAHAYSIVTIRTAGAPKVLFTALFTNCTSWTSHTATRLCFVDALSETVVREDIYHRCKPELAKDTLVGKRVHRLQEACKLCVKLHALSDVPHLKGIAWDVMVTDDGLCFFEGNHPSFRIAMIMATTKEFLGIDNISK